jgi:hypothetical protein
MMSSSGCMRSALSLLSLLFMGGVLTLGAPQELAPPQLAPLVSKKVDVDLFVMSKCP